MTAHQDDLDIDRNLRILCESANTSEFSLTNFVDKNGRRIHSSYKSKKFAELMVHEGLIRVFGDFCSLEKFGLKVFNSGGWLKHLSEKKIQENLVELKAQEKEALELVNLKLQKEASEYQKSIRKKEEQIRNLTRDNLRLNNWDIRFRWYIAIGGFIIGIITQYFLTNN